MWIQSIYYYYTCLYYNLIYLSEKINFVVVRCCCFTSLDLRARLPDTKIKDEKKMKFSLVTLGLIGANWYDVLAISDR